MVISGPKKSSGLPEFPVTLIMSECFQWFEVIISDINYTINGRKMHGFSDAKIHRYILEIGM